MSSKEDRFQEKFTPYLRVLGQTSKAVRTMYFFDPEHENLPLNLDADLFFEKALTSTKGLVCKYPARALLLLSYTCAANCRYCERQDRVGVGLDREGRLTEGEIRAIASQIENTTSITEVIFSGGDPLTHPKGLELACELLKKIDHVKILRIHTRFPLQLPEQVDFKLLERIQQGPQAFYFSLHIDHPDELTPVVESVIGKLRRLGFILLCQTVFLKGVNDSVDDLALLFTRLAELGVRPYYIYHCQPIPTTMRFVMTIEQEMEIMTALRERISGLAFPQHVLELQHTAGKILVPTNHWDVDVSHVRDFLGNCHDVVHRTMKPQGPITPDKLLHFLQRGPA